MAPKRNSMGIAYNGIPRHFVKRHDCQGRLHYSPNQSPVQLLKCDPCMLSIECGQLGPLQLGHFWPVCRTLQGGCKIKKVSWRVLRVGRMFVDGREVGDRRGQVVAWLYPNCANAGCESIDVRGVQMVLVAQQSRKKRSIKI